MGSFIGRDPGRSVAENLREAERIFPPLVDYAGERGVRLMIENCVMEGWHPDGYPGNLAYSPELWEWMFELGLYLNFDPSHLLWLGIDPVAALRPYVDRVAHAHAKDVETFPAERNRYGFFGRVSTREEEPWDMGWWRYRIPGLGQVDFPHYVDALYEGGFDGVLSVEHEDPVWGEPRADRGRPADRPSEPPRAGGHVTTVLEVRDLVKEFPGVKALQGVNFDVVEGEVHCPRAERSRQVDADQVHLRRPRPTSGEILFKGEPLPVGDPAASLARGVATIYQELDLVEDLTVAESIFLAHEPRRGPLLDFDRMRRDSTEHSRASATSHLASHEGEGAAAGRPADRLIARALSVDVRLLIMDEPSAILDEGEIETLFEVVRRLTADGVGVVYISHRLDEIRRIGNRVTVLADGRTTASGIPSTTPTEELVELMVGQKVTSSTPSARWAATRSCWTSATSGASRR